MLGHQGHLLYPQGQADLAFEFSALCSQRSGEDSQEDSLRLSWLEHGERALRPESLKGEGPQILVQKAFDPASVALSEQTTPTEAQPPCFSALLASQPNGPRRQGPNLLAVADPPSHSQEVLSGG